ncbi:MULTISPECIES: TonB-dependent receptor [unclassified Sphingomonas]|uniref:TonB-dependent receptor domain-containing protein n=1 Tax=unclassified Sphingomonas TaxID=196159 RepID=UPI00092B4454|nr:MULTISPECIES: TonB-dependent receptor [unclassified Sphingomonas]OJU20422.1 MAG: hypothetical protein BGN95_04910 [Sphingomonas sp. 66-10]
MRQSIGRGRKPLAALLGSSGAAALASLATPASAQEAPATEAPAVQEVVVTGSRIRSDGSKSPTPLTVVSADQLAAMGPSGLVEGVSQLPQFFASQSVAAVQTAGVGGNGWFLRGGYGNLDLRGLGINRTLTLLNGHRVISSSAFGGVDVNVIPKAMVNNVETVTGGASAAYGTDAVAGVVNFKLNRNFTGLRADVQQSITSRGDNRGLQASVSYGTKLGDRGHILLSGEFSMQDGVHTMRGRDWYKAYGVINGNVYPDVVSTSTSFNGLIYAPGTRLNAMQFLRDGSGITPFVASSVSAGTIGGRGPLAGSQSITNGGSGDYIGRDQLTIFPDADRSSIYAYADYEIADHVTVYAQYIRGQNKTFRYNEPTGSLSGTPSVARIYSGNAFLPASVQQIMTADGIESFEFRRIGGDSDFGRLSTQRDNSVMNSFAGGLTWDISGGALDGWQADLYYQYGTNKRKAYQNGLRLDRIFAALDAVTDPATGQPVCRVSLYGNSFPGCVPINLFGQGNASAAAIDYVTGYEPGQQITTPIYYADTGFARGETLSYVSGTEKVGITDLRQHQFEFSMNGTLVEGWAGPIKAAFGGSWRREAIRQVVQDPGNPAANHDTFRPVQCSDPKVTANPPPGLRNVSNADCGNSVALQYSKVSNIRGAINVTELFGETQVPLLSEAGPIRSANLHLAGRWANYTGSGGIWAYKAGLEADIADFLRLRGTWSRDVRAANLSERFDKTGGITSIDDPRTPGVIESISVTNYSGGNPRVNPEKADTWTAGAVIRPGFVPGLSLSADYYDIRVKGAIARLGSQGVFNGCVIDAAPELCALVSFDTAGQPTLIGDIFINVNQNRVRGLDVEANYTRPMNLTGGEGEAINLRLFANWLFENSQTLSNGTYIDRAGQTGIQQSDGFPYGLPKFKLTGNVTYTSGGFSFFTQARYIGSGTQENARPRDAAYNKVDSAFYLDLRLAQKVKFGTDSEVEIFGSVTNLTDRSPPVTPYYSNFYTRAIQFNSVLFDLLGRRFTVGMKFAL